ncbi:hypothetical protein QE152_g15547 [Popillia japonica]|uniref:Uncharacterized protein n=1 Tax=Popillia japonica TaxID=7064 RepID=A0AAW1L590_POPJA
MVSCPFIKILQQFSAFPRVTVNVPVNVTVSAGVLAKCELSTLCTLHMQNYYSEVAEEQSLGVVIKNLCLTGKDKH